MPNAWISHVKKTMGAMKKSGTYKKGDGLKKVILAAKKTYKSTRRSSKKGRRGGEDAPPSPPPTQPTQDATLPDEDEPVMGGRRGRKSRSTRRKSRR